MVFILSVNLYTAPLVLPSFTTIPLQISFRTSLFRFCRENPKKVQISLPLAVFFRLRYLRILLSEPIVLLYSVSVSCQLRRPIFRDQDRPFQLVDSPWLATESFFACRYFRKRFMCLYGFSVSTSTNPLLMRRALMNVLFFRKR